jgi:hypothetical protein
MMRKLVRAWCLFGIAALASCQGDSDNTQTSSAESAVEAKPITLRRDTTGLVPKTTTQGTTVRLGDRFRSAVVARRNPDGTISTECHEDESSAESFMQGPTHTHHGVK